MPLLCPTIWFVLHALNRRLLSIFFLVQQLADFPTSDQMMNGGRIAIALCLICKGPLLFQPLR